MNQALTDADVRRLLRLQEQLGADLHDMVVVNMGQHAYRRADGIGVVQAVLRGP